MSGTSWTLGKRRRTARNKRLSELRAFGVPVGKLAEMFRMTPSQVWKVTKEYLMGLRDSHFDVGHRVMVLDGLSKGSKGWIVSKAPLSEIGVEMWVVDVDGHRQRIIREDWLQHATHCDHEWETTVMFGAPAMVCRKCNSGSSLATERQSEDK